jgi:hypothetical protein
VFLREDSGERILVAHNLGTGPAEGNIELRDSALLIPILEGSEYSSVRREGTGWHLVVPPYESAVWRVK